MLKLTTGSMFRITAFAALALAVANWWPRTLPPARDGSVTWYRGFWGSRSSYKITGTDGFGCTFNVKLRSLPGYSPMIGAYPDGTPACEYDLENSQVIRARMWWKDGTLQSNRHYRDGKLDGVCTDYYPNGKLRSKSTVERNVNVGIEWYDQNGHLAAKPDTYMDSATFICSGKNKSLQRNRLTRSR